MTALATIPDRAARAPPPDRDQGWPRRSLARSVGAYGLSARDLETLGWVSEQYAVRMDHLAVLLGRSPRTAQRFARRTRAGGLAHCRPLLAGEPAWLWLTGRGQREAPTTFKSWSPRLGLLAHIAAVNRVRLHVQRRAPESVWVCERSLARDLPRRQHLPDAVVQPRRRAPRDRGRADGQEPTPGSRRSSTSCPGATTRSCTSPRPRRDASSSGSAALSAGPSCTSATYPRWPGATRRDEPGRRPPLRRSGAATHAETRRHARGPVA